MNYDKLCEMDVAKIMGNILGPGIDGTIQPDSNIGEFGNINNNQQAIDVKITLCDCGGAKVDVNGFVLVLPKCVVDALRCALKEGVKNE